MVCCCTDRICFVLGVLIRQVLSQPPPSDPKLHLKYLEIVRANHPAISWRFTMATEIVGTTWCQPLSYLPDILQRSRITPAIFGNSTGQPPSHLPANPWRFIFKSDAVEKPQPTAQPSGSGFRLYCMVLCCTDGLVLYKVF